MLGVFVDRDFESAEEFLILRRQLDLPDAAANRLGRGGFHFDGFRLFAIPGFVSSVETNGGLKDQKDVITSAFDLTDRGSDPVGIRKRLVDRVSEFLHQIFQAVFQIILPSCRGRRFRNLLNTPSISSDAAYGYPVPRETITFLIGWTPCCCSERLTTRGHRELLG